MNGQYWKRPTLFSEHFIRLQFSPSSLRWQAVCTVFATQNNERLRVRCARCSEAPVKQSVCVNGPSDRLMGKLDRLNCKETAKKQNRKFEKFPKKGIVRFCGLSPNFQIHVSVSELYIPTWSCRVCWRKYVDRSWENINRSQTHECRNWG
jgi:hypothetical protein